VWPFPEKTVKKLAETAEKIIVPEMNLRQIFYEVERVTKGAAQVIPLNKIGGGELITPEELLAKILEGESE
jgi:2-oxoglutarate ferredoxin oxidoreductase subunit alpha